VQNDYKQFGTTRRNEGEYSFMNEEEKQQRSFIMTTEMMGKTGDKWGTLTTRT